MHNFGVRRFNNLTKLHLWCHKACLRRKYFLGSVRSLELVGTLGTDGTDGTDTRVRKGNGGEISKTTLKTHIFDSRKNNLFL